MAKIRTHYDNLRVARNAPASVIKAAYKALCQTYHPDKFQGNKAEAERIMKLINASYTALTDPVKRAEHDDWIQMQEAAANQQSDKAQFRETGNTTEQEDYQKQQWRYTSPPVEPEQSKRRLRKGVFGRWVAWIFCGVVAYMVISAYQDFKIRVQEKSVEIQPADIANLNINIPQLADKLYTQGRYVEALSLYQSLAEQGNVDAQYSLGVMYTNGEGVAHDNNQAAIWYRKAAEQGDAKAQNNLGVMYTNGEGVVQDNNQAAIWYRKSAEQGDANAQYNLGLMYHDGKAECVNDFETPSYFI